MSAWGSDPLSGFKLDHQKHVVKSAWNQLFEKDPEQRSRNVVRQVGYHPVGHPWQFIFVIELYGISPKWMEPAVFDGKHIYRVL